MNKSDLATRLYPSMKADAPAADVVVEPIAPTLEPESIEAKAAQLYRGPAPYQDVFVRAAEERKAHQQQNLKGSNR